MITIEQARRISLSFPGADEAQHHGHPDFRVNNKIFATLRPEDGCSVVKLDQEEQADLVANNPRAFSLNAWSKQGWRTIHLNHVVAREYRALVDRRGGGLPRGNWSPHLMPSDESIGRSRTFCPFKDGCTD